MIAQNASGNTALHLCALYNQVRKPTNTHTHSPFSTPSDMLSPNIHFRRFLNKRYAVVYIIVYFYNVYLCIRYDDDLLHMSKCVKCNYGELSGIL